MPFFYSVLSALFMTTFAGATSVHASERILFIGDSHAVGAFGVKLDSLLGQTGAETWTYASCGSSPWWWFKGHATPCGYFEKTPAGTVRANSSPTPLIATLAETIKPTVVVVALGANLVEAPIKFAQQDSRKLALFIQNTKARCLWVGPPHGRNKPEPGFSQFYSALKAAVEGPCEFIDSRPYAHYPDKGGDGVHYDQLGPEGMKMARSWAASVFNEMKIEGRSGELE